MNKLFFYSVTVIALIPGCISGRTSFERFHTREIECRLDSTNRWIETKKNVRDSTRFTLELFTKQSALPIIDK